MTTSTYNNTPPTRPVVGDLGGGAKQPPPGAPANSTTQLTANDCNAMALAIAAFAKVTPTMVISVTQLAGVYTISQFAACGDNVLAGSITVTKNGVGDVTLSWAANLVPGAAFAPCAWLNGGAGAYRSPEATMPTATSVRIKMTDGTGAAVECNFSVEVG